MAFLGIELDEQRNAANAPVISRDGGRVSVRIIHTDEKLMIARTGLRCLGQKGGGVVKQTLSHDELREMNTDWREVEHAR